MKTLFMDTHGELITLIIKDGNTIYKEEGTSNRSHSEVAMPTLKRLLDKARVDLEEIDEIIVVIGPGSFTGVRIGVTIAKTLAFDMKKKIKTISSLEMYGVSSKEGFDVVSVEDSKGVYSSLKKEGVYEDAKYQRRGEFEEYIKMHEYKILREKKIDIEAIEKYLEDRDYVNPHLVNPIYIKEIEALK